ncbi:N-acetyltransferase [Pseudomonas phage VW-6S]|nr:N-acetyltransferase [Pseudomonas phage VW-6S]
MDLSKLEPVKTAQDVADQLDLEQARAYLRETNWHAFALLEDGTPIPSEIATARTAARATISRLAPAPIN